MQIVAIESDGDFAIAARQQAGMPRLERINMMLLGPQPPGTWILAAHGLAIETVADDERQRIEDALAALAAALDGHYDPANHFADLPPH